MWKNVATQGAVRAQTKPMPADATAAITATVRTDGASSVWAMRRERQEHLLRADDRQEQGQHVGQVEAGHDQNDGA